MAASAGMDVGSVSSLVWIQGLDRVGWAERLGFSDLRAAAGHVFTPPKSHAACLSCFCPQKC